MQVERRNMQYRLFHWGTQVDATVLTARAAELLALMPIKVPPDLSRYVLSPMPGLLAESQSRSGRTSRPARRSR